MQWLTLVSEDYGIQRLKAERPRPAVVRTIGTARIGEHPETRRQQIESQRQGDRRKGGDRRRKQVSVILDTRSNHSRRALLSWSGEGMVDTPSQRINVYA